MGKVIFIGFILLASIGCSQSQKEEKMDSETKIIFLHHSTGKAIWRGDNNSLRNLYGRILGKLIKGKANQHALLPHLFKEYNRAHGSKYSIVEQSFPKKEEYGWNNYPFDYYNIWVKNEGEEFYMGEPGLDYLSRNFDIVMFKHCFPVSKIQENSGEGDINSDVKNLNNYKLQYLALRDKLHQYKNTRFIVWTGAALLEAHTSKEEAERAREFFEWVKNEWNQKGDNIFIFDFQDLQTEGGLYLNEEYAVSPDDSHPNNAFSEKAAGLLFNRMIDIIEKDGSTTDLKGNSR